MSFPLNPINGARAVVNGIKYIYNSGYNAWRRDFNNVLDRLYLVGGNEAFNTSTGDLVVYGGGAFGGNLVVNGTIIGSVATATNLSGGSTGTVVYQSQPGQTAHLSPGSTGTVLTMVDGLPSWSSVSFNATLNLLGGDVGQIPFQASNSTTVFSPFLSFNSSTRTLLLSGTTNSTNSLTGALVTYGGMAIGRDLRVAGSLTVGGDFLVQGTLTYVNTVNLAVNDKNITLAYGASTSTQADQAGITVDFVNANIVYNESGDSWSTNKNFIFRDVTIGIGSASTTPFNGSLKVLGGVGINGALNVNGTIRSIGNIEPFSDSAYDLGSAARKWRDLHLAGSTIYLGSVTISASGSQLLVNGQAISGNSNFASSATTATNIIGGARGAIFYQASSGTTVSLSIGATGTVLRSLSGTPTWSTAVLSITAGTGTFISTSSGNVVIWTTATGGGGLSSRVTDTTDSTSTTTGAFVVDGGIGVGRTLTASNINAGSYNHLQISNNNNNIATISSLQTNQSMAITPNGTGTIILSTATDIRGLMRQSVVDITAFGTVTVATFTTATLSANIYTMQPVVSTSDVYLPRASSQLAGLSIIFANRSGTYTVRMREGTTVTYNSIGSIFTGTAKTLMCDGFRWYLMN